uniref:Uncharacterized protein n=1 Tax=Romanomermis culicivorax TaxID=13658 RepID=A0A915L7C3_ROMCU
MHLKRKWNIKKLSYSCPKRLFPWKKEIKVF